MPDAAELFLEGARRTVSGDRESWRDAALLDALARADGDPASVRALADRYDALLLLEPRRDASGTVTLLAAGSAERRHRGAFSTPPDVAASLARRALPAAVAHVVDPACGAGALLRAAAARLLALGQAPDDVARALHGVDADPVAVALCRAVLRADLSGAGATGEALDAIEARVVVGDALLPLVWEDTPTLARVLHGEGPEDPVTGWTGGFGAVVANPPWERLKVLARDWEGRPLEDLRAIRFAGARAVREGGRHPLTGTGELNAYLPFLETCWRLLPPEGHASVIVPAGVAADRSAARLVHALVAAGAMRRLHLFDPPTPLFVGVNSRVGVAVVDLTGGPTAPVSGADVEVAVGLSGPDADPSAVAWPLDAATLRLVNPNTWTAPVFASARDARIVTGAHRRWPVLRRREPPAAVTAGAAGESDWGLGLHTSLHMTRTAHTFRSAPGEGLTPLWEAKHTTVLDPTGGRSRFRYWVPEGLAHERYGELCERGWLAAFRNVSTSDSPRTLAPVPLPAGGVANSLPLISSPRLPLLLSALASLPVDYLVRQKHSGANLNFHKIEQLPLPPPSAYDVPAPWAPDASVATWLLARLAESVVWVPGLEALAAELQEQGVDDVAGLAQVGPVRRLEARAEADAAHAVVMGFSREDLAHLLGTFPTLQRQHERVLGRYDVPRLVLDAYDRLTR